MNLVVYNEIINLYSNEFCTKLYNFFFYNVLFYKFGKLLVQHVGLELRLVKTII